MKRIRLLWLALLAVILVHQTSGEKILFLLPIASKSHANVFEPLTRALAERGHDIVNLSPFELKNVPKNVKQIQLVTKEEIFGEMANPFEMRKMGNFKSFLNGSFDSLATACGKLMKTNEFQNLLEEKFDLIIVDILMNFCVMGIVPIIKAPTILVTTFAAPTFVTNDIGNRFLASFVADSMLDYTHKMNFRQRLGNFVLGGLMTLVSEFMFVTKAEKLYRESLPNGKDLPGVHEIMANTSLVLSNSHYTLTYPRPLLPDLIEVGGMHTRPAKPLPKDIEDFLNGSGEDGFILFSLGSIVPAKVMPEKYRKTFVKVFSKLKQRIIWKWETETMPDLPPNSNILLKKWVPQQDILGHPKIKLFMTHGGLLSTQEAVFHGVPLLGFPIFGDQDLNIKQAVSGGYAKFFEILDLTEESLEAAIKEMITNPKYDSKAKELSKLFRDIPEGTPLNKAVYWTEYVMRHKGAPHLRSAARDLNFFQYYLLDVIAVLALIVTFILSITFVVIRAILRKIFGRKSVPKSKKVQ